MHRETKLETISVLDLTGRSCRRAFRLADKKRHAILRKIHCPTALVTARLGISRGLDTALRAYGHWRRQNLPFPALISAQSGAKSVYCPIGSQFLLESCFLQPASLWFRFFLVTASLGAGADHDADLPES